MLGKIVRVSSPDIIQFFYPEFVIRDNLSIMDRDKDVIYVGPTKPKIKQYLTINTKRFISLTGPVEIDYTKQEVLAEWVYEKRGKKIPNTVREQVNNMDIDYVEYLCKVYYVSGHWLGKRDDIEDTMFDLFAASVGTTKELLRVYFSLREIYPYEVIQASFITFLSRVITIEDQTVSPSYMKVLKQANQRFGNKIRGLVIRLGTGGTGETDFINCLLDLR